MKSENKECSNAMHLSDEHCITDRLNSRPRKALGYATPNEVFDQLQKAAAY